MSETYRDLGGGITDPDARPDCSWNCDGMGLDRYKPIRKRGFVDCPVHRLSEPRYARPGTRRSHGHSKISA